MEHAMLFFIVLGVIALMLIFRERYPWPTKLCENICSVSDSENLHVPKPVLKDDNIIEPWNTTTITVSWSCDFSKSKYDPSDVYFRLDISNKSFSQTWLYTHSDITIRNTGDVYTYQLTINSGNGFEQGLYNNILYAYLRDSRINTDPEVTLDKDTTSKSNFTVTVGACIVGCEDS